MQDAYLFGQLAAAVLLILFSVSLGYLKLRCFGFGFYGLLERQINYEERRKTGIGRRAQRPQLIRDAENPFYILGLSLLPILLNGALLLSLYRQGLFFLVPVVAIPLAFTELLLAWRIQKRFVPMYQADYDRYMCLTDGDNRYFDGTIVEQDGDAASLLSGGRVIRVSRIGGGGQVRQLRLFVSLQIDQQYSVYKVGNERIRIFYRTHGTPNRSMNQVVDGELLGFQPRGVRQPDPNREEFERRVTAN